MLGSGAPASNSGLAPTFIVFADADGNAIAPAPGITEIIASSGLYRFQYNPSFTIFFNIDGATTGLNSSVRYVQGAISPLDYLDTSLIAQGSTLVAIGTSLGAVSATLVATGATISNIGLRIGTTASSFGATNADPVDLYGYLKRAQEFQEGNASYSKTSGAWSFFSRGSSTLLGSKTLSQNTAGVTKI